MLMVLRTMGDEDWYSSSQFQKQHFDMQRFKVDVAVVKKGL